MNINSLLVASLTVIVSLSCLGIGTNADAQQASPNIVVFLVDDMGVMDTSVPFLTDNQGQPKRYPLNDFYQTPNMQRLADRGVRFNQFYAMSVCSPTRISIMTGQNAARHHSTNWIKPEKDNRGPHGPPTWNWQGLNSSDVTLPGLLQKAGYRTIHVGKGHFGPNDSEGAEPLNLGFDVNVAGASFGAPGSYYGKENFGLNTKRSNHAVPHLQKYHGTETFLTEALTLEAKKQVTESVRSKKPFYLYMSHYAVHGPHQSDPRFANHYKDSGKPKKAQAFATLVEGMDKSLGDLLDHLDELGIADNTIVFFLGDNGTDAPLGNPHAIACAAPLRGKKGAHYEGGMRVPFIAAWAKTNAENKHQQQLQIPAGTLQTQIAAVQDLYPTITKLAGATSPSAHVVDGIDLSKLLTATPDKSRDETFLMHYPHSPHRSDYFTTYRHGDWKVIYHYIPPKKSKSEHYQLYNLASDPSESNNLAGKKPAVLTQMMQKLKSALKAHDAQYPVSPKDGKTPLIPVVP